jgi:subtilisin-like proprotein convertase family protein
VNDSAGDGDGYPEPGESFRLWEKVLHRPIEVCGDLVFTPCPPAGDRTNVGGAIGGQTDVVTFTRATSRYPRLREDGGTARNRRAFRGSVLKDAPCGWFTPMSVVLASDQAQDQVRFRMPIGAPGPRTSYTSSDVPKPIPDHNTSGVLSTLKISKPGLIRDLNVRLDWVDHPDVSELTIRLVPPGGSLNRSNGYVTLTSGGTAHGEDFRGTIFDDEAPNATMFGHQAPYSERFSLRGSLRALYGTQQRGYWTLHVFDYGQHPGNVGTLRGWGVDVRGSVCHHDSRVSK